MKKILQVVSCLEKGGTEAFIMNNYRNINRNEFLFDFLVFVQKDYPYNDEIKSLGGNIYYCGKPKLNNLLGFIKNVTSCIKKNGPYDAIHSHCDISNAWVMFSAFLAKVPIRISHCHSSSSNYGLLKQLYVAVRKVILRKISNCWLACSKQAGANLYGKSFFEKKGYVINNGIDVDFFLDVNDKERKEIKELKKMFNIKNDDFVVGNISRFDKNKNIEFVVKIFYELLKLKDKSVLVLGGGDGGELSNIKKLVNELNISDKVRFIGVRNDIKLWLKTMNAYIFPSISEGLPIAMLEAQAAGTFCYISNGVSREVDMGVYLTEFIDLSADATTWAEKIYDNVQYDIIDKYSIKKMFLNKDFSIGETVKKLEKMYSGKF